MFFSVLKVQTLNLCLPFLHLSNRHLWNVCVQAGLGLVTGETRVQNFSSCSEQIETVAEAPGSPSSVSMEGACLVRRGRGGVHAFRSKFFA